MTLSLAFSPCPNDCFMFDAIVNRRIDLEGLDFSIRMEDVETLNREAFAGDADVTKLSYHAFAHCARDYVLLDAGSALGRNCGPLLISKRPIAEDDAIIRMDLKEMLEEEDFEEAAILRDEIKQTTARLANAAAT